MVLFASTVMARPAPDQWLPLKAGLALGVLKGAALSGGLPKVNVPPEKVALAAGVGLGLLKGGLLLQNGK